MKAAKSTYVGLFLTALSTLAYELVLTRIFSVTIWYHFAFLAVSLAMLGMTVGALAVQLYASFFKEEETQNHLAIFAMALGLSAPLAYLVHASLPILWETSFIFSAVGLFALFVNCAILAIPFVCSGVCVCLCLTRFPSEVPKLYAADLMGAAAACILVAFVLNWSDGPSTLLLRR